MMFKVDVETVDSLRRRLAVEVPAETVSAEIEKAFAELARAAKVPGFRPGRVPRAVLERMFGDRVRAEVFGRLIQDSYAEAIEGQQIVAVGQPEIVTEQTEAGAALRYRATVEVKPDVTVEGYTGLTVDRPLSAVTDADVMAGLGRLQQSLAQLHPVTDRAYVERGDIVSLDYEARIDGRLTSRGENRDVELGANGFPAGFDDHLIGTPVGATLDFDITYPSEHPAPELAGKSMHFHVNVRSISMKDVPPLDDEFAKDHGECSTLEELRQRVRRQLEEEAARRADEGVRRVVVAELVKRHDVPVPNAMVQRRTEALVEEVLHDWQRQRGRLKDDSQARAHLRKELEPRAHEQVKIALLLEAIARQEAIGVTDEEVEARVSATAQAAGAATERVRALYQQPEARRQLRAQMLQSRAVDLLVSRAHIRDVPASSVADLTETG
jgi:trigger factor